MNNTPLVSIAVIAYNSSKTIVETLESIKAQTYPNIELIISDDCSKDNTVAICRDWIEKNKSRFVRTEIVMPGHNMGVSANYNRAERVSHGEWCKPIAGDDVLLPEYVQIFMDYIKEHPQASILFSDAICFGGREEQMKRVADSYNGIVLSLSREKQIEYLTLCGLPVYAATIFYNAAATKKYNLIRDERVRNMEDIPYLINALRNTDLQIDYIDIPTTRYRISESSLSTSTKPSKAFAESLALYEKFYRIPYLKEHGKNWYAFRHQLVNNRELKRGIFWKVICKVFKIVFGPVPEWTRGFDTTFCFWLDQEK